MNKKDNKNKNKNGKIIDYFLYGVIIFNVFYIVNSNRLLEIGKNKNEEIGVQAEEQQTNENINQSKMENSINEEETNQENVIRNEATENQSEENQKNTENSTDMPSKMGGYNVLGKLVIEKINVNKNILDVSNKDSLKLSVVKLYGPEINTIGNFCICGHNWKGMLKRAKELKVGDTFYLIDRKNKNKINYEIYNIYSCMPKELDCLKQNTNNKKEVTIITCNPGGVTRLIIKGREV